MLTATVEQCRTALSKTNDKDKNFTAHDVGWTLLELLDIAPTEDDQEDGLEADNGSDSNDGRALRIIEQALDWEATWLISAYCTISKAARAQRKRLKAHVVISKNGIVRQRR